MTPLSSKPAVVIVQPSYHSTNVKCAIDGVELVRCTWHFRAVWDYRAWHYRTQDSCALRKPQSLETAAERVCEDVSGGIESHFRIDLVVVHVIGNIQHFLVVFCRRSFGGHRPHLSSGGEGFCHGWSARQRGACSWQRTGCCLRSHCSRCAESSNWYPLESGGGQHHVARETADAADRIGGAKRQ